MLVRRIGKGIGLLVVALLQRERVTHVESRLVKLRISIQTDSGQASQLPGVADRTTTRHYRWENHILT